MEMVSRDADTDEDDIATTEIAVSDISQAKGGKSPKNSI